MSTPDRAVDAGSASAGAVAPGSASAGAVAPVPGSASAGAVVPGSASAGAVAPVPEDPRWRVRHLPLLVATATATLLCAASVGFLVGGVTAAAGAAAGVALVSLSYTMTTLVVAWADTVRPALVLPLGVQTYVVKYALIGVIMAAIAASGWPGMVPMGWGVVAGVVVWTAVQAWWVLRVARPERTPAPQRPERTPAP